MQMALWAGLQDFRHRMSKHFLSQPYQPSSGEMLKAAAKKWRENVTGTPARKAAKLESENQDLKDYIIETERQRQRRLAQQGQRYRPQF
jgi:hypothetical protein